jgi:transketolase
MVEVQKGSEIAFITTGSMVAESVKVAEKLKQHEQIIPAIFDMHTIKPIDGKGILDIANKYKYIVTIEEHGLVGGLGSLVVEFLADNNKQIPVLRIGVQDKYIKEVGTQQYLRKVLGLDAEGIFKTILKRFYS